MGKRDEVEVSLPVLFASNARRNGSCAPPGTCTQSLASQRTSALTAVVHVQRRPSADVPRRSTDEFDSRMPFMTLNHRGSKLFGDAAMAQ